MNRNLLNGISLRVPFLGAISTLVAEGDWRGAGGTQRSLISVYREEPEDGITIAFGWLYVFVDAPSKRGAQGLATVLVGCACTLTATILKLIN